MKEVSVVILNWNGKKYLQQFLPSVINYSKEADIFIVDNDSTDGSVQFLKENFSNDVTIISLLTNEGFSKGYNSALKQINTKYYILLNTDVEVTSGWITPLYAFLENNPHTAACQPKIKSFFNKDSFEYAGAAGGFIDYLGYPFCRGRIFDTIEKDEGQYDNDCEIFWATGACLFINREKYWEAGGLDNDFFAHMEEIDLCWRIKNLGYKIYYISKSEVFHVGGGTLNKLNPHKTFLNFRNGLYLLFKNLPEKNLYAIIFQRMVLDGVAGIKFIISLSPFHCLAILKAHYYFYKNFIRLKKKRKANSTKIMHDEIYNKSLIADYFLKGRRKFSELVWKNIK